MTPYANVDATDRPKNLGEIEAHSALDLQFQNTIYFNKMNKCFLFVLLQTLETRIEGCDSTATIQATETETDETESERESTKQYENCDIT